MFLDFALFRVHIMDSSIGISIGEIMCTNTYGALFFLYFDCNKETRDFDWDFLFLHSLWRHFKK